MVPPGSVDVMARSGRSAQILTMITGCFGLKAVASETCILEMLLAHNNSGFGLRHWSFTKSATNKLCVAGTCLSAIVDALTASCTSSTGHEVQPTPSFGIKTLHRQVM